MAANGNTPGVFFLQRAIAAASNPAVYGANVVAYTTPANGMAGISKGQDKEGRKFFICGSSDVDGDCVVE
jgi:hypothetical protein